MTPPHGFPPNVTSHLSTNHTDSTLQTSTSIYTAAYVINLLLGLPTNSYVLWLIITGAGSGVASEFFTLNLSVSEIIFCFGSVVFVLEIYVFPAAFLIFGSFVFELLVLSRPLFQCCICVERYLAVVHPVTFLKYRPLRYRVGCSAVVWLIVLVSSLYKIFKELMSNYVCLAQYLVCIFVDMFCCLAVLRALKQPGPGEGGREREGENPMKKRAFRIILIILMSMIVNYVPLVLVLPLHHVLSEENSELAWSICSSIMVMTGFVQPLLYLHRVGKPPFIWGLIYHSGR